MALLSSQKPSRVAFAFSVHNTVLSLLGWNTVQTLTRDPFLRWTYRSKGWYGRCNFKAFIYNEKYNCSFKPNGQQHLYCRESHMGSQPITKSLPMGGKKWIWFTSNGVATLSLARSQGLWLLIHLLHVTVGSQEKEYCRQDHTLYRKAFVPNLNRVAHFRGRPRSYSRVSNSSSLASSLTFTAWFGGLWKTQRHSAQVPLQKKQTAVARIWITDSLHLAAPPRYLDLNQGNTFCGLVLGQDWEVWQF